MRRITVWPLVGCLAACSSSPLHGPDGQSGARVHIDSAPTPAWIFVDGNYVGCTPVDPVILFTHATRFVEVAAVPMYPSQTRQVKRLVPPALPESLQFFLDNPDPGAVTR
jgi:hypothetical protein